MKKTIGILLICVFCHANAIDVSLNGTAGQSGDSLLDSLGNPVATGTLGLLLVDTSGNGIDIPVGAFSSASYLGGSDDYLVSVLGATDAFGNRVIEFSAESANNPGLSQGDQFYVAWFPGLTTAATSFSGGESYGLTTRSTTPDPWELPADTFSNTSAAAPGGSANLTVVPEPASYAMIFGLLGLGMALVRRRRRG